MHSSATPVMDCEILLSAQNNLWLVLDGLLSSPSFIDVKTDSVTRSTSNKRRKLTLAQYVQRRNGVPFGHAGSLRNMLYRSLGAGTFAQFWRYWNPVWGYYLGRYIHAPLKRWLPPAVSLITTFVISGALHDAAASAVTGRTIFILTPWFFIMGVGVVMGQALKMNYAHFDWPVRAFFNMGYVGLSLALAYAIKA